MGWADAVAECEEGFLGREGNLVLAEQGLMAYQVEDSSPRAHWMRLNNAFRLPSPCMAKLADLRRIRRDALGGIVIASRGIDVGALSQTYGGGVMRAAVFS